MEKGIGLDLVAFSKLAKEISQIHSGSRKVTLLVSADLLIILSDIDGLYDHDPKSGKKAKLIHLVENIDRDIVNCATETSSPWCVGGMDRSGSSIYQTRVE